MAEKKPNLTPEEKLERTRAKDRERMRLARQRAREMAASSPEELEKLRAKWRENAQRAKLTPEERLERRRAQSRERARLRREKERSIAASSPEELESLRSRWRAVAKKAYSAQQASRGASEEMRETFRAKWRDKAKKSYEKEKAGREASEETQEEFRAKWRSKAKKEMDREKSGRLRDAPEALRKLAARRKEYRRRNMAKKYASNLHYKLKVVLRSRLRSAIKNGQKRGSAIRDLGCTIDELKAHLEMFLKPGMTWENFGHGTGKWCVDHLFPISRANLQDRAHLLAVCNWMNLRPEWFSTNVRKSDKVSEEAQRLFGELVERFRMA